MLELRATTYGRVGPNEPIELVANARQGSKSYKFPPELREIILNELRPLNGVPQTTPDEMFWNAKRILEAQYPGGTFNREDLDIILVADFIGYMGGFWPDPQKRKVEFYNQGLDGVIVRVPQGDEDLDFNTNMLRFIRNDQRKGKSLQQTVDVLESLHTRQGKRFVKPAIWTIHRLRFIIRERRLARVPQEKSHWDKVEESYDEAAGDEPSVLNQKLDSLAIGY